MRRSAAPSQLGLANKRPRFTPPLINKPVTQQSASSNAELGLASPGTSDDATREGTKSFVAVS